MFSSAPGRWLALAFFSLLLAQSLGNPVLLAGAVFLLVVVLIGATLVAPRRIAVHRELPRTVCWAGDGLDVRRHLQVGGGVGPVYVYDELPGETQVTNGSNLQVVWHWPGERTYDLSYRIQCPKRGVFTVPETVWETEAAMGFHQRTRGNAGTAVEISVVPRNESIRRVNEVRGRARSRRTSEDVSVTGVSTTDFTDLRPYIPGDPMRSINWKASARNSGNSNPLLVNQYEPEGRKAVWIFLDGADYMEVGPALSPLIDHAVEAAGTIAQYYLSRGYTLGACLYNCESEILTPEMGSKQFRRLTNMLTRLKPGTRRQNLLESVEQCKSFLFRLKPEVYVITRLDVHYSRWGASSQDQGGLFDGIRRLVSLRRTNRRSNQIRVVHLEARGFQTPDTTVASRTHALMRREVEPVSEILVRSGAMVLRWDPQNQDFSTVLMSNFFHPKVL